VGAPRLAIIIPALNEADTIAPVLEEVRAFGQPIVVDDGSTDDTAELSRSLGADVVTHEVNQGYDGALSSGFARADALGFEYAITIDADGQLPGNLIPEFVKRLDDGADLVVGIRDFVPRVSELAFQIMARKFYGLQDPLCGMKAYRMSYYRQLGWFDSYRSIGTEFMLFIVRQGGQLSQLPVPTAPRVGQARIGGNLKANYIIGRAAVIALFKHFGR